MNRELLALTYIANLWKLTSALCAHQVSENMARAAYANLMVMQMLMLEYYPKPQALILQFRSRA